MDTFIKMTIKKYRHPLSLMAIGIIVNFGIAIMKLIYGYIFSSYWLLITAIYYLVICVVRAYLLHAYHNFQAYDNKEERNRKERLSYRRSGYFLILLSISYGASCAYMLYFHQEIVYPNYILFGVVGFSFYKIGSAIVGLRSAKKHQSKVLTAIKIIACLDACVSIVASQCAILTMQQSFAASSSSAYLGMFFSLLFIVIGSYLMNGI